MHSSKVFLSMAALAGTSLAQASDAAYCSAYQSSLFAGFIGSAPTTPAAILPYASSVAPLPTTLDFEAHATQLCDIFSVLPSSLLPEFKTFASELLEFGASYRPELVGYITACEPTDEVASMTSKLASYFTAAGNICNPTPAPTSTGGAASNGTYPTYSNSPAPTATATTTPIATAAAARPTGVLMGAAAMGCVVGAAAML